jgi:hypothetical protein
MKAVRTAAIVLAYGDHPDLIRRCLTSLIPEIRNITVWCNQVGRATTDYLSTTPVTLSTLPGHNVPKWEVVRNMLPRLALNADWIFWFDDDCWLEPHLSVPRWSGIPDGGTTGVPHPINWHKQWLKFWRENPECKFSGSDAFFAIHREAVDVAVKSLKGVGWGGAKYMHEALTASNIKLFQFAPNVMISDVGSRGVRSNGRTGI